MSKYVVLEPRLSEKAYATSKVLNSYVFMVPVGLNKHQVADAVAAQFDVKVETVNIMNVKGKAKRTITKAGKVYQGREALSRKAYVTLKKGEHLPIFDAEEEAEQKAEKEAEKTAKKATKTTKAKTESTAATKKTAETTSGGRRFFRRKAT